MRQLQDEFEKIYNYRCLVCWRRCRGSLKSACQACGAVSRTIVDGALTLGGLDAGKCWALAHVSVGWLSGWERALHARSGRNVRWVGAEIAGSLVWHGAVLADTKSCITKTLYMKKPQKN
jgi:hypothetical protein